MAGAVPICGIYAITRIGTDECYIGQSINIRRRFNDHRRDLKAGKARSEKLQIAFDRHGLSAFAFEILASGIDPSDAELLTFAEQEFLDSRNCCFNIARVASSNKGLEWSAESRMRISEAQRKRFDDPAERAKCSDAQKKRFEDPEQRRLAGLARKGKPSPWKGKTPSEGTRALMRDAQKGKPGPMVGRNHSEKSKAKMSASRQGIHSPKRGTTRSAEANAKQSATMKAKNADPEYRRMAAELRAKARAQRQRWSFERLLGPQNANQGIDP